MWGAHPTQCPRLLRMVGSTSRCSLDFSSFSRLGWWWVHMSKHVQAKFGHLRMYVFHPQPWETRGSHLPTHRKPILKCPHVWRTLWETLLPGLLPRFFSFWTSQDNLVDFLLGSDSCRPWWVPISSQEIVMRMSFLKCRKYWCGPDRCRAFSFCHIGY